MSKQNKFKNKYRVSSARLQGYDYSSNGAYFITICTKNREHFFGDIIDDKMQLSKIGNIANDCWKDIPKHFPFLKLGEWVIMPNHMHGIVIIDKNNNSIVETLHATSLQNQNHNNFSVISPKKYSLGSIIRSYKSAVSNKIHKIFPNFSWQQRFHDHIIRNEKEFENITEYILYNTYNWQTDDYF